MGLQRLIRVSPTQNEMDAQRMKGVYKLVACGQGWGSHGLIVPDVIFCGLIGEKQNGFQSDETFEAVLSSGNILSQRMPENTNFQQQTQWPRGWPLL